MRHSTFTKLVNVKLFRNSFCLYFRKTLDKDFRVIKSVKILMFEGLQHFLNVLDIKNSKRRSIREKMQ